MLIGMLVLAHGQCNKIADGSISHVLMTVTLQTLLLLQHQTDQQLHHSSVDTATRSSHRTGSVIQSTFL